MFRRSGLLVLYISICVCVIHLCWTYTQALWIRNIADKHQHKRWEKRVQKTNCNDCLITVSTRSEKERYTVNILTVALLYNLVKYLAELRMICIIWVLNSMPIKLCILLIEIRVYCLAQISNLLVRLVALELGRLSWFSAVLSILRKACLNLMSSLGYSW